MTQEKIRRKRLKKLVNILYVDSYAKRIQKSVCENEDIEQNKIEKMIGEYEEIIRSAIDGGEDLPIAPPGGYMYRNNS